MRVTHHDVQAAEELDSLVDRGLDVRLLAHVRLNCGGLDVRKPLLDECERLLRRREVDVDEEDIRAFLRKEQRGLESDAPATRETRL